jgi:hypothetical protein
MARLILTARNTLVAVGGDIEKRANITVEIDKDPL